MLCPDCNCKMEMEPCPTARDYKNQSIPSAHYRCDDCDVEFSFVKGQGLFRLDESEFVKKDGR